MAALGALEAWVNALPESIRAKMMAYTREWAQSLRIGVPAATPVRAENLGGSIVPFTTPGVANAELAVPHGLGRTPHLCVMLLALDTVNETGPVLTIARAADATYLYVKSASTGAHGHLYVE